jgi:hypothetical protein
MGSAGTAPSEVDMRDDHSYRTVNAVGWANAGKPTLAPVNIVG